MDYLELSVAARPEAVEAAADLLRRYAPAGVSIEPPCRAVDEEGSAALVSGAAVRLRAWLPAGGAQSRSVLAPLRRELRALNDAVVRPLRVRTVRDTSWADAWKRRFRTLRVGRRIVIRPSWRRYSPRRGDIVIELDPGLAFGTGQHATTQLCLEALEQRLVPGAVVLDVGSGSGVLAIAAAMLGAARVDALDIDPMAVQATKENAARNGVRETVRAAQGSLGDAWPFPEPPIARYDLVLANLSSRLVQELAPPLVDALRPFDPSTQLRAGRLRAQPGGAVLVSGVIEEQAGACQDVLAAAGGHVIESQGREGWRLLVAGR